MTKDLLDSIYTVLKQAVSATTTSNIYYAILPNEELLKGFSVVYSVSNPTNTDTFDKKETVKNYSLNIQVNNPTTSLIVANEVFIKAKVYNLYNVNGNVKNINLLDEDLFYDFDLKIFTEHLKFNIQYSV